MKWRERHNFVANGLISNLFAADSFFSPKPQVCQISVQSDENYGK
jgi:hypothetical protein